MKIIKFKKLKDNRYKLTLETQEEIILYDDIILKYNFVLRKEIDEKKLDAIKKENNSLECYYKSLKYLASKNRSKKEIINYLNRFSYERKDIDNTIHLLEEKNYINEDSYITSFINDQIHLTNNGPGKIKRKLLTLGLEEEKIEKQLSKIEDRIWKEKLEKIISKKIAANRKDSKSKLKEKIIISCMQDGFKKEEILFLMNQIEIPMDNALLEKEAKKLYIKLSRKYEEQELFYQLKGKLIAKGFSYQEVEKAVENIQNDFKSR